tara:strand:- start:2598 stop:2792 length:195 start_codon:yes stop_codon:yes gene_type:complete
MPELNRKENKIIDQIEKILMSKNNNLKIILKKCQKVRAFYKKFGHTSNCLKNGSGSFRPKKTGA